MENAKIAEIFDEIAGLLELRDDNPFRIRSYRNAAQSVSNLSNRLDELVEQGQDLSKIPNIGDSTAKKIQEILETGTCKRLETLHRKVPAGLSEFMHVPGVGPRKAMQLHKELHIKSLDELKEVCKVHKVQNLDGMGVKTEQQILKGIATVQSTAGRMLYQEAADRLVALSRHIDSISAIKRWEVAGSFRRGRETIGDLDILIHAKDRAQAAKAILTYDAIRHVLGRGRERVSVRLESGLQVDFRFFDTAAFGAAWMYFTGSKSHNIRVRRIAQKKGWKLNEYGLFNGDYRLAGKTEKAVYKSLDMKWIPPELRENRGEVEQALDGHLARLIELDDIRGDFHCHTTASDGKNSIEEMAGAARDYDFDFLAITDHSRRVTMAKGLDDDRARKHADAIRKVDEKMKRLWLLAGMEVDILKSGKLDLKEKTLELMDWVVASVHFDRAMSRKAMTDRIVAAVSSGVVHCLGHPRGRYIGKRDPIAVDLDRIFAACVEHGVCLEINCQPERLDLPDTLCRNARDAGVTFALGTDAHSIDGLRFMPFGVNVARRGWLRKGDVLNTQTITKLRETIKQGNRRRNYGRNMDCSGR